LITEFRRCGWQDAGGTAVAIVRALECADAEVPTSRTAAAVPAEFLAVNHASRADVEEMLVRLAGTVE
jgi:hypothetical protein